MNDAASASARLRPGAKDELRGAAALFRSTIIGPTDSGEVITPTAVVPAPSPQAPKQSPSIVSPSGSQSPTDAQASPVPSRVPQAARDRMAARSQRTDGNLTRGTYYFRRDQLVDLKRIRQRTLELTGEEVDLSDLVREGIDLLLKRYTALLEKPNGSGANQVSAPQEG